MGIKIFRFTLAAAEERDFNGFSRSRARKGINLVRVVTTEKRQISAGHVCRAKCQTMHRQSSLLMRRKREREREIEDSHTHTVDLEYKHRHKLARERERS